MSYRLERTCQTYLSPSALHSGAPWSKANGLKQKKHRHPLGPDSEGQFYKTQFQRRVLESPIHELGGRDFRTARVTGREHLHTEWKGCMLLSLVWILEGQRGTGNKA